MRIGAYSLSTTMKLAALVLALSALALPAAQAAPDRVPGLVYTPGYGNSILALTDPLTLGRGGARVRLGGNASSWAYSPGGRYLAVASFPQRLTVVEAATLRVVSRIRLAQSGGVAHAVTWTRPDRVLAVVDTPGGAVVATADPLRGAVVRRVRIPRPYGFQFDRLPGGLVFLLGARGRIAPVQLAIVDAEGRPRVLELPQAAIGNAVAPRGGVEQRVPGLAVDPVGRRAFLVSGDGTFTIDLRSFDVAVRSPLRTLAKSVGGTSRSAHWLGGGMLAVSGSDWSATAGRRPFGLRLVDTRDWVPQTLDPTASAFRATPDRLLVVEPIGRRALLATAYGLGGRLRYQVELPGVTWLRAQGRLGYACRDDQLRAVVDLRTGETLRGAVAGTRCATVLAGNSPG
jgi:hypothetical protein